jgi:hypothetical protein
MRLKQIIAAQKLNLVWGSWKTGPMPKTAFPLTRSGNKPLRFGAAFEWYLLTFEALGETFRLLVAVHYGKQEYYAHLGMECGGDMRMLASYEFHGTHPGWHVHSGCEEVSVIPVGRFKGPWKRRIPSASKRHRKTDFGITRTNALVVALQAFGLDGGSETDGQVDWVS